MANYPLRCEICGYKGNFSTKEDRDARAAGHIKFHKLQHKLFPKNKQDSLQRRVITI